VEETIQRESSEDRNIAGPGAQAPGEAWSPPMRRKSLVNDVRTPALVRDPQLVRAFDLVFGLQEFFTPRFTRALGALVDRAANGETVIAGSFGAPARELLTCLAGFEKLAFECPMLAP
jgi:hypothetical protein